MTLEFFNRPRAERRLAQLYNEFHHELFRVLAGIGFTHQGPNYDFPKAPGEPPYVEYQRCSEGDFISVPRQGADFPLRSAADSVRLIIGSSEDYSPVVRLREDHSWDNLTHHCSSCSLIICLVGGGAGDEMEIYVAPLSKNYGIKAANEENHRGMIAVRLRGEEKGCFTAETLSDLLSTMSGISTEELQEIVRRSEKMIGVLRETGNSFDGIDNFIHHPELYHYGHPDAKLPPII